MIRRCRRENATGLIVMIGKISWYAGRLDVFCKVFGAGPDCNRGRFESEVADLIWAWRLSLICQWFFATHRWYLSTHYYLYIYKSSPLTDLPRSSNQHIVIAPKNFSKMVKRKKGQPPIFEMKEQCPDAIGISGSTCEINGDMFNRWKLPIPPPEQRLRRIGSRQRNLQDQSLFFRLPAEIRRMIYLELMGYRRVHIRYVWKEPPPFSPQPKYRGRHWNWWQQCLSPFGRFPPGTWLWSLSGLEEWGG